MNARSYAPEWEDERDRLARRGMLRKIGTHPSGEPKYQITWKGRIASWKALALETAAAFGELLDDPVWSWWILGLLGSALGLAGIMLAQHVMDAHGMVGL